MNSDLMAPTRVAIEFSCLINNKLTADLYVLLHWKYHNNYKLPWTIIERIDKDTLEYLEAEDFIKITGNKEFELRDRGVKLFEVSNPETSWLEFLGKFPLKVPSRGGSTRALKIANPDSKGNIKLKKKYISLIKNNPQLHTQIINVLEAELEMRKKSNELQFMQGIEPWINQATYDKYAYLLDKESNTNYKNEDYM